MTTKTNNVENEAIEGEFIAMGDEQASKASNKDSQQERPKTKAEEIADDFLHGFEQNLDNDIADNELAQEQVGREHVKRADFDTIMSNYKSITEQSNKYSNKIAETIHVSDLSEESTALLDETIDTLDKMQHERTMVERIVQGLPNKRVRETLGNMMNVAERQVQRNQSVKDFAQNHFDQLTKKQEFVDNNRISIDQMKNKLLESSAILDGMLTETKGALEYMKETGDGTKAEEIKGKQLVARISKQIVNQRELVEQTLIYEGLASVVSENIESALPEIKNQFIDQVSITSSLKNLKNLQDNVKKTNEIILKVKSDGLSEMDGILDTFKKEGVTETAKARELREKHRKAMESLRSKYNDINNSLSTDLDREISENLTEMERVNHVKNS